ncbi:MAG TPA: tetratricopeptide repeat protein [Armatimonadetes bacterium]|nr:tetratricopeptide repeat protein [Armatimonadota bacterium]
MNGPPMGKISRGSDGWRTWLSSAWGGALGLVVLLLLPPAEAGADYLSFVRRGLEAAEQGRWEAAEEAFLQATAANAEGALGYLGLGLVRLAEGQVDEAARGFKQAESTGRAPALAAWGLGLCYFQIGHWEEAARQFALTLRQRPDLTTPHLLLALIHLAQGWTNAAGRDWAQVPPGERETPLAVYVQALCALQSGREDEAQQILWRLYQHWPKNGPSLPLLLPLRFQFRKGQGVVFAVSRRQQPLRWEPVASRNQEAESSAPLRIVQPLPGAVVSGQVKVAVALRSGYRVKYLTLRVNGQFLAMTNRQPYRFLWDTSHLPPGAYTLTVYAQGETPAQGSVRVFVGQADEPPPSSYPSPAHKALSQRLVRLLRPAPRRAQIEQLLAALYQAQGRGAEALAFYEQLVADDRGRSEVWETLLGLYAAEGVSISPAQLSVYRWGVGGGRRVALTFDDGPNSPYTEEILRLLDAYRVRATFFVVGRMVERFPHLIREIARRGHEIANHTYSHCDLQRLSLTQIRWQLLKTQVLVARCGGQPVRLFRPPGGHLNARVKRAGAELGYVPVLWTVNASEYEHLPPEEAIARLLPRIGDGAIVLLHNGADNTLPLLPYLLRELRARGYQLVTVSEIIQPPRSTSEVEGLMAGKMGH